jgi:hypothetical protein
MGKCNTPREVKWEVFKNEKCGYTSAQVIPKLNIKNRSQISTWMRWSKKAKLIYLCRKMMKIIHLLCYIMSKTNIKRDGFVDRQI